MEVHVLHAAVPDETFTIRDGPFLFKVSAKSRLSVNGPKKFCFDETSVDQQHKEFSCSERTTAKCDSNPSDVICLGINIMPALLINRLTLYSLSMMVLANALTETVEEASI